MDSIENTILSGDNQAALVAAVLASVFLVRRFGGALFPALKSDVAGVVLAVLSGVAQTVLDGVVAGQALSVGLVVRGLLVAIGAMGAWSGGKKIATAVAKGKEAAGEIKSIEDALSELNSGDDKQG